MPLGAFCPECDGRSAYAGHDERGTVYTCEAPDGRCAVFDHWMGDVRKPGHNSGALPQLLILVANPPGSLVLSPPAS